MLAVYIPPVSQYGKNTPSDTGSGMHQRLKTAVKTVSTVIINTFQRIKDFLLYDLRITFRNYTSHDGELSTCALAFFLLISFIPASLVIISILSIFFKSDQMVTFYLDHLRQQLPSIDIERIISIIDRIVYSKRYLAMIWVPFLFWWGSLIFDIFERVLEKAFQIEESRKYWKAKIRHFIIILGIGISVLLLIFLSHTIAIAKNTGIVKYIEHNVHVLPIIHTMVKTIGNIPFLVSSVSTLIVNTLLFFIIYRFVPPKKLDNRSILQGSFFAAVSYEIIKSIFSYYITEINDYTSIFGSLSTIVILMIWIWYTCFLLVLGAEMTWVLYEKRIRAEQFDFREED